MPKKAVAEKPKPEYRKFLTEADLFYIERAISGGYYERDDYPPYALSSIEDRQRFSKYVSAVLRDLQLEPE